MTTHEGPVEYYDTSDDDPFEFAEATLEGCRDRYSSLVGYAMFLQSVPSPSERSALLPIVRECLVGAELDLPVDISSQGLIDAVNNKLGEAYASERLDIVESIESCVETYHTFFIAAP